MALNRLAYQIVENGRHFAANQLKFLRTKCPLCGGVLGLSLQISLTRINEIKSLETGNAAHELGIGRKWPLPGTY